METIAQLTSRHAQPGKVIWIGVRPGRRQPVEPRKSVRVTEAGLEGDHYSSGGKRAVTLIQYEHFDVIRSLMKLETIQPDLLRRNIVVAKINLTGLRNRQFKIGNAVLEGTGLCAPCSRMEEALGAGGYTAMRGHGGITAHIAKPGAISLGDEINPL